MPQITIPDIFMQRDAENSTWTTFCPFEVKTKLGIDIRGLYGEAFSKAYLEIEEAALSGKLKVTRQFEARKLFKQFMRVQFDTGLPYVAFTDTINATNPNAYHKNSYGIPAVNLCTESFSNVMPDVFGHTCNLLSVNLSNIDSYDELGYISRLGTKCLDYGIDLTNSPDHITRAHNDEFRTIGVGQMGMHDYLAKRWLNFSALEEIRNVSECIQYNCVVQSIELAKERGSFKAFPESRWANGEMIQHFNSFASGKYDWNVLQSRINQYGMRNSQLTSPAPTTSTSIYQDCAASALPIYSAFFSDDNKNGALLTAGKYLALNPIGYGKTFAKHSIQEIVDAVSENQKFIDTGFSMEWILDQNREDFSAKDLYDGIHYAWKKGIKAIYYIRTIKKNSTLEAKEDACVACAS
jgi:ribonucleoside-diphosphate reductase alpha chain